MIKVIATAVMMCFLVLGQAQNQKLGHINSSSLLIDFPKVKTADEQVMAYQKGLEADFEAKGMAFQKEYEAFNAKVNSQEFSDVQLQKEQVALSAKQQQLQQLQYDLQQQILKKREELYAPILIEVENAVKAVGEENGYTMIFDASLGGILYGLDTQDVTSLVRAKLGL